MVVRGSGFASRAIEAFGGGWPCHMANMLGDGSFWDSRDDWIHFGGKGYKPGVQHRPAGYLQASHEKWAIFEAPAGSDGLYANWVETLESQEDKPYDRIAIRDFAVGAFTGEYQDRYWGPLKPALTKAWFCDEYAIWASGTNMLSPWPIPAKLFTLTPGAALIHLIGAGWELCESKGYL